MIPKWWLQDIGRQLVDWLYGRPLRWMFVDQAQADGIRERLREAEDCILALEARVLELEQEGAE